MTLTTCTPLQATLAVIQSQKGRHWRNTTRKLHGLELSLSYQFFDRYFQRSGDTDQQQKSDLVVCPFNPAQMAAVSTGEQSKLFLAYTLRFPDTTYCITDGNQCWVMTLRGEIGHLAIVAHVLFWHDGS